MKECIKENRQLRVKSFHQLQMIFYCLFPMLLLIIFRKAAISPRFYEPSSNVSWALQTLHAIPICSVDLLSLNGGIKFFLAVLSCLLLRMLGGAAETYTTLYHYHPLDVVMGESDMRSGPQQAPYNEPKYFWHALDTTHTFIFPIDKNLVPIHYWTYTAHQQTCRAYLSLPSATYRPTDHVSHFLAHYLTINSNRFFFSGIFYKVRSSFQLHAQNSADADAQIFTYWCGDI